MFVKQFSKIIIISKDSLKEKHEAAAFLRKGGNVLHSYPPYYASTPQGGFLDGVTSSDCSLKQDI